MVTGKTHHCALTISGTKYELELAPFRGAYRELDAADFSPRLATGDLGYSSLGTWNVVAQEDFRHGFGHRRFKDEAGYHRTVGSLDTRHKDVVQLATAITASDEDLTAVVNQFIDYGGYLWAATGAGLRVFDPGDSSWAACTDTDVDTEEIYALLNNGAYLFVAVNGAQILKASTVAGDPEATVFTTTGVDSNADDYRYMALGGGKMWASKDGDNHVHYAVTIDGTDWDGDENDTNRITVGPGDPTGTTKAVPITGMQWFDGAMYVAREDGLWGIPEADTSVAYRVLDWSNERRTTNGKGMLVWQDKLIIPVGPRLIAYTGASISDITPPTIGRHFPYTQYGNFEALATFGLYLYVAAQEGETATGTVVLRPDAGGSNMGLSPKIGSNNYEMVDEAACDYSSTYNFTTSNIYKLDTYNVETSTALTGKTINSVTIYAVARGPCLGDSHAKVACLESGQTVEYGTALEMDGSWLTTSAVWITKPSGGAWTKTEIDSLEIGVALISNAQSEAQVTQCWAEVAYQADTPYRLLCWDGSAWHNLGSVDAGGKCLWFSAETDDLWICDYDDTAGALNYNTRYMQTQEQSFLPKDDYPTSGTHEIEFSRVDGELRAVDKCFHEWQIFSENLTSARYLTAYYRISGETWVSLGNVTQSPYQAIDLSDITGKHVDFKLAFVTDVSTQSPILEAWALEFLARPDTVYAYAVTMVLGDEVRGGLDGRMKSKYTASEFRDALRDARDSKVPITLTTPWNEDKSVFVSAYNVPDLNWEGKRKEALLTLNLIEVE